MAETDPYRGPVLGTRSQPLLRLSMGEHRAWLGSTPLDLRPAAFRTLAALARRPGAWVERDVLAEAIWGDDLHFGNPAYVDKYLSQVRTALRDALAATDAGDPIHAALDALRDPTEADPVRALLETRRGVGNRLGLEPDQVAVDEGAS